MSGMIRRLRWKIVGISMLFVTLVLAAVFTGVMLTARSSLEQSSTRQLEKALRGEGYDGQNGQPCFVTEVYSSGTVRVPFHSNCASTVPAAGAKISVPSRSLRAVPMRPCPASTCCPGTTSMVPLTRFVRTTVPLHRARMPCSVPAAMSGLGLAAAASTTSRPLAKLRLAQENSPLSSRAYSPACLLYTSPSPRD